MGWLQYFGFKARKKTDACDMYQEYKIDEHFQLIKNVCNQVFSLFYEANFIILFPRMDFKNLGWVPQLFFIHPKNDILTSTINVNTTDKPIANFTTRNTEYVSYNVVSQPQIISLNKGILTSLPSMLARYLEGTYWDGYTKNFQENLVKEQLKERVLNGSYFSVYSPSFGLHELCIITSLTTNNTVMLEQVEISMQIKILKTFNYLKNKC